MDSSTKQFGLVVAFLLPGFIGLAGVAPLVPSVGQWLQPVDQGEWGFGPPIYALLCATTVGMIVSCFRWIIVDHLLEWTGVARIARGYEHLAERLEVFDYLIDVHYRYYQFYANTLVALLWSYLLNRFMGTMSLLGPGTDLGVMILCAGLLAGSRDALSKYRRKLQVVLNQVAEKEAGGSMTNGADHHEGVGSSKASAETKPQPKTAVKPEDKSGGKSSK